MANYNSQIKPFLKSLPEISISEERLKNICKTKKTFRVCVTEIKLKASSFQPRPLAGIQV